MRLNRPRSHEIQPSQKCGDST
ncbi:Hypothetical protein AAM4_2430, partial [Actinomyces succiniciruminis]